MSKFFRRAGKAVSNAAEGVSKTASGAANSATDTARAVARAASGAGNTVINNTAKAAAKAATDASYAVTLAARAARDAADILERGVDGVVSKAARDGAFEAARMAKNAADAARAAADQARRAANDVSSLHIHIRLPGVGGAVFAEAERAARQAADEAERAAQAATELAEEAAALAEELAQQLSEVPAVVTGAIADAIKNSPLYEWLLTNIAALYMDKPHYIKRHEELPGKEVYYVNGILTERHTAENEADVLAVLLHRPVWLIHNPTFWVNRGPNGWTGSWNMWDDLSEAVYDRTWPETLGAGVKLWPVPTPLGAGRTGVAGLPFTQLNTTTRQLTHLLYHANEPISIVSHSQGCLQLRNASLTTALFRGQDWIKKNLMWVATGLPLSDVEIWPWPKFKGLVNAGDTVAQVIGLQGGPGWVESFLFKNTHHEPTVNYFPKIEKPWLLP